jgi:hypothetical protein
MVSVAGGDRRGAEIPLSVRTSIPNCRAGPRLGIADVEDAQRNGADVDGPR